MRDKRQLLFLFACYDLYRCCYGCMTWNDALCKYTVRETYNLYEFISIFTCRFISRIYDLFSLSQKTLPSDTYRDEGGGGHTQQTPVGGGILCIQPCSIYDPRALSSDNQATIFLLHWDISASYSILCRDASQLFLQIRYHKRRRHGVCLERVNINLK